MITHVELFPYLLALMHLMSFIIGNTRLQWAKCTVCILVKVFIQIEFHGIFQRVECCQTIICISSEMRNEVCKCSNLWRGMTLPRCLPFNHFAHLSICICIEFSPATSKCWAYTRKWSVHGHLAPFLPRGHMM